MRDFNAPRHAPFSFGTGRHLIDRFCIDELLSNCFILLCPYCLPLRGGPKLQLLNPIVGPNQLFIPTNLETFVLLHMYWSTTRSQFDLTKF
jgi:hypothetical protein